MQLRLDCEKMIFERWPNERGFRLLCNWKKGREGMTVISQINTRNQVASIGLLTTGLAMMALGCSAENDSISDGSDLEVQTITLASGLVVDVRGPKDTIDALPETPTGAQLCEEFSIALTVTFDERQTAQKYAATAVWNNVVGDGWIAELPFGELAGYLAPVFPAYDLPGEGRFGGVASNPIAVFPIALSNTTDPLPEALAIFHRETGVPMAVFNHSSEGPYLAFPSTWQDAENLVGTPSTEVISRYIEGPESLAQCEGYAEVIDATMKLSVVEDLATCGAIMAWPYSLPDVTVRSGTECVVPNTGYGVTLAPASSGRYPCPVPADAPFEWSCFSSGGSTE